MQPIPFIVHAYKSNTEPEERTQNSCPLMKCNHLPFYFGL